MHTYLYNFRRNEPPPMIDDEITFDEPATTTDDTVVELTVDSWDEVEQLCLRRQRGPVRLTVSVPRLRHPGPITVTLLLPDGFSVSLDGEVVAIRPDLSAPSQTIVLGGLDPATTARLRAMAAAVPSGPRREASRPPAAAEDEPRRPSELARGTENMKVSEMILSNQRLKDQIELLAKKMRPR